MAHAEPKTSASPRLGGRLRFMCLKDLPDTFPWHHGPHETTEDEPPAETQRRGAMRKNIPPTLAEDSKEGVPSPTTNRPTRRPQACEALHDPRAPTARHTPARGNAPGLARPPPIQALKGRNKRWFMETFPKSAELPDRWRRGSCGTQNLRVSAPRRATPLHAPGSSPRHAPMASLAA